MSDIQYIDLTGGLDTRDIPAKEYSKILFADVAKNMYIDDGFIRTTDGNRNILASNNAYGFVNISTYLYQDNEYLIAIDSNGDIYRYNDLSSSVIIPNKEMVYITNLPITTKPLMIPCGFELCCITEKRDPLLIKYGTPWTTRTISLYSQVTQYASCGCYYKGKLFLGCESTLRWSKTGDPTDFTASNDAGYTSNFHADNSNITAIKVYGEYLVIHKHDGCYLLSGNDNSSFTISPLGGKGSVSKFSVINTSDKQIFWNDGLFNLSSITNLGQIIPGDDMIKRIKSLFSTVKRSKLNLVCLEYHKAKGLLMLYVVDGTGSELNKCYVFNENYKHKPVVTREAIPITGVCYYKGEILTCTSDGRILQEFYGDTFDGQDIDWTYRTQSLHLNSFLRKKKARQFICELKDAIPNKQKVNFYFNKDLTRPKRKTLKVSNSGIWDESLWDQSSFDIEKSYKKKKNISKTFDSIQIEFESNADQNSSLSILNLGFTNAQVSNKV